MAGFTSFERMIALLLNKFMETADFFVAMKDIFQMNCA
jgi:hypothetical protein